MTPILLLHGALGSSTQLESLKSLLENSGSKVYTMNFSGHSGKEFKSTFGIETFASDVLEFMDNSQLERVTIFGYSMGGYVAVWLALLQPDRIEKIITLGTKFDWSVESAEKEVRKLNPDKIIEKIPAFARILETRHAPNDWKMLLHKTGEMMLTLGSKPLLVEENLKKVKVPVAICLGDQDDMADRKYSEEVSEMIPDSTFTLFEKTPHPIEKVNLDLLARKILED